MLSAAPRSCDTRAEPVGERMHAEGRGHPRQPAVSVGMMLPVGFGIEPPDLLELCVAADASGLHAVGCGELAGPEAFSLMGAAAAATRTIRLETGVVPVSSRSPALLAMAACTLAALSEDRFVLGIGAGSPIDQLLQGGGVGLHDAGHVGADAAQSAGVERGRGDGVAGAAPPVHRGRDEGCAGAQRQQGGPGWQPGPLAEEVHRHAVSRDVAIRQQAHDVAAPDRGREARPRVRADGDDVHAEPPAERDEPLEHLGRLQRLHHGRHLHLWDQR